MCQVLKKEGELLLYTVQYTLGTKYLFVGVVQQFGSSCQKYTRLGFSECSSVTVLRNFYCMLNFVRGKLCMQITIDDLKAYRSFFTKAID